MPPRNGHWPDLIELWLSYTSTSQSPFQFRLWTGISLVASALERRVWAKSGKYITWPNLYIMLVGAPGVGKQVIEEARGLFSSVMKPDTSQRAFRIASDSVTRASLVDELSKAKQTILPPNGTAITSHVLGVFSEEFRVLLPAYEQEFIARLDKLYNGPELYAESRRTGNVRELSIEAPLLNLLAGAQPAYLADTFPDNAWATGLCRRLLMIYSAEGSEQSIFTEEPDLEEEREELRHRLAQVSQLFGHAKWEAEAAALVQEFEGDATARRLGRASQSDNSGRWPLPSHSRLTHYVRSRTMMVIKLSIVSAISARAELVVRLFDVQRALDWLLRAEALMPDIFREMKGRSDREVMEELHKYVMNIWAKNKGKPLRTAVLVDFLSERVPSEKVDRVLAVVERTDMIARVAGTTDMWQPKAIYGMKGVE